MKGSILAVALAFSSLGIPVAACIVDNAKPANQANAAAMDRCPYYLSSVANFPAPLRPRSTWQRVKGISGRTLPPAALSCWLPKAPDGCRTTPPFDGATQEASRFIIGGEFRKNPDRRGRRSERITLAGRRAMARRLVNEGRLTVVQ
jgi:hypothetical protein